MMSPFRLNEFRAKIQFVTSAETPSLIAKAAAKRDLSSNTEWLQHTIAAALAKELDLDLQQRMERLPPNRATPTILFGDTAKGVRVRKAPDLTVR